MTANYTVDGIEYNWRTGAPKQSETSTTKFPNYESKINNLVIDPDSNSIVIQNSTGDTIANYNNGTWDPVQGGLVTTQINKGVYDKTLQDVFGTLSKDDQSKVSIYTKQYKTHTDTTSSTKPTTLKDGLTQKDLDDIRKEEELTQYLVNTGKYKEVNKDGGTVLQVVTNPPWRLKDLKDLNTVDFPRDPEGFYIGRYPINQKDTDNFDYLKITCYDYEPGLFTDDSSQSIFKIKDLDKRVKTRRGVVSLPIQPGISESNSVGWGDNELSPIKLAGANIAGSAMDFLSGGGSDSIENFKGTAVATAKEALGNNWEAIIKSYFAGQAVGADLIGRATGQTINKNVEVLFNGPNLRTFGYSYRFTPREPREAREIKEIIRFFKKSMAPKRSNSRIFLKSPNVFKLKYTFRNGDSHPFLNNIKICALNSFTVDYTPDGSYSTYDNEGGVGDGSMTSYQVSMSFMEMTPIYNDDFWSDDEGQEGTGF